MKLFLSLLAVAVGLYLLDRVGLWMEARGWIYYRRRRGSSGTVSSAFLEVQSLIEPSRQAELEVRRQVPDEAAQSGEPPDGDGVRP